MNEQNEPSGMEEERGGALPSNLPSPVYYEGERLQIGSVLLSVSSIFLLTAILQAIFDALIGSFFPSLRAADWYSLMITSVSMYLIAMPFSLLLFRMGVSHAPEKKEKPSLLVLLGLVSICFALTYAGSFLGIIFNAVIGAVTGEIPENGLESMTASSPFWANLLFVGILAPLLEELVYRKLVIDRLRRYGDLFAILFSGVLFGLVHGNFYQFFYATAMGVLFACVYVGTGRLRYTLILHLCINLIGSVYTTEMLRLLDMDLLATDPLAAITASPAGTVMLLLFLSFLVLCMIASVVSVILFSIYRGRRFRLSAPVVRLDGRGWVRVLLLNPALWIFLVFLALLFL